MKYLITGGTGFVGKALCKKLLDENNQITILSRSLNKVEKVFGDKVKSITSLDEIGSNVKFDVVVNLAGEGIAEKRWSEEQKQELINSRVNITKELVKLFDRLDKKPSVFISASAIGYYGGQGDETLVENSKPNDEFTHQLCKNWENEAIKAEDLGIRTIITRFGVVLGKNGGTIEKMLTPFKLGLGGKIGSGKQYFSWVYIDDVVETIIHLVNNKKLSGKFNVTSPKSVTNAVFTKSLGEALNRPTIFPMPSFIVKILFGEMGEVLLLNGQRVYPKKLLDSGLEFKFDDIDNALKEITND